MKQVRWVRKVLPVLLGQPVPKALLVWLVQSVRKVQLVKRVLLVPRDPLGLPGQPVPKVRPVFPVQLAPRDPQVKSVLLVPRDLPVKPV